MSRIFVTGAAGYIGGHTVKTLIAAHPEYDVVALVRDEKQAAALKVTWPNITTVLGTLDDEEVLRAEAARADVVLQLASSDHVPGVKSLISGLAAGKHGRFIHISGTGILNDASTGFGNASSKVYDDIEDIVELINLPETALHRVVDDAVITAGQQYQVPTAIVCPPTIYGVGEGPVKKRSIQIPVLSEAVLKRGRGFTVGQGGNVWDHIHISDLANAFVLLVEEALKPNGGSATWGPEGYYFVESGEFAWKDVSALIARVAKEQGKITTDELDELSVDEASKLHPWAPVLWGGNCRSRASRIRSLGWKPTGPAISECLLDIVQVEIDAMV